MTPFFYALFAFLLVVGLLAIASQRKYGPLFGDAHFLELAGSVPALKEGGLAARGRPVESPDDPRVVLTSAGLVVVYTVEELPDRTALYSHLSLSHRNGPLAWAAGGRFAYLILRQLGVRPEDAAFAHGQGGVVHAAFLTAGERTREFERADVGALLAGDIERVKEEGGAFMTSMMRSGRLLPAEDALLPQLVAECP